MRGMKSPQVASLSSACSDFISSLGAATAANTRVLSYERPTYLLFPWELKDGAPESIFIWIPIMLCSQCSGTFSGCLPGASEAFSSAVIHIRRVYVVRIGSGGRTPHELAGFRVSLGA